MDEKLGETESVSQSLTMKKKKAGESSKKKIISKTLRWQSANLRFPLFN